MSDAIDERKVREACPSHTAPIHVCPDTGMDVVDRTGLTPVYFVQSVPERGWNRGEVHGLKPANAKIVIANGLGMPLKKASAPAPDKGESKKADKKDEGDKKAA